MSETPETTEEVDETPIEVIIKKEETKPEPDYDYDSIDLTEKEIVELETEIDKTIKKRVNQDSI